ncbi:hypothetical protein K3495_g8716 [Podosphaera aphanis]|nr:hypothetical protein K3495_g8716 [Podosphaera aphanis]
MSQHATLFGPPPCDVSKSQMENLMEVSNLTSIAANTFTNTRALYHPPGARGVYGGAVIAQSLTAAQMTVPQNFAVHSMHCYFVMSGDSTIPIIYHVEHLRDGRSYATRTVQAKQRGKCIFTTTASFVKESTTKKSTLYHALTFPEGIDQPRDDVELNHLGAKESPFVKYHARSTNQRPESLHERKSRMWMKTKEKISNAGGHQAHAAALAYMSDSNFIGTIARAHDIWQFGKPLSEETEKVGDTDLKKKRAIVLEKMQKFEGYEVDLYNKKRRPELGMMVSLDHIIYFYEPKKLRADEWLLSEMSSPWSGQERGVVTQHIFAQDGTLIATCHQEGVVRLKDMQASKL